MKNLIFKKKPCKTEENDKDKKTGAQKARKDQTSSADTHLVPTRGRPTCDQSEVNVNDIGLYVSKIESTTDQEKFDLIQNVWKPSKEFVFPETIEPMGRKRQFQYKHLQQYSWLVYAKYLDGCFCLPCVLFGDRSTNNSCCLNGLLTEPLVYWTSAASRLKHHSDKSDFHKNCIATMSEFVKVMEHKSVPIRQLMTSAINERIKENRAKLVPIVQTIMSCRRQNLALRGHHDDSTNFDTSDNHGNFQTLLDLRIEGGDKVLQNHFKNAPRNVTYLSKTIHNENNSLLWPPYTGKTNNYKRSQGCDLRFCSH